MGNKRNRKIAAKRKAQKPIHDSPKRNKTSQETFLEETEIKEEFIETHVIIKESFKGPFSIFYSYSQIIANKNRE